MREPESGVLLNWRSICLQLAGSTNNRFGVHRNHDTSKLSVSAVASFHDDAKALPSDSDSDINIDEIINNVAHCYSLIIGRLCVSQIRSVHRY